MQKFLKCQFLNTKCLHHWKKYFFVEMREAKMSCGIAEKVITKISYDTRTFLTRPWGRVKCFLLEQVCLFTCFFLFGSLYPFRVPKGDLRAGKQEPKLPSRNGKKKEEGNYTSCQPHSRSYSGTGSSRLLQSTVDSTMNAAYLRRFPARRIFAISSLRISPTVFSSSSSSSHGT